MNFERTPDTTASAGISYDAGLRSFFQKVYNTMSIGLLVTGAMAWLISGSESLMKLFYGNPVMHLVVALAPLGFMFFGFTPRRVMNWPVSKLAGMFYAFSAVFGVSLAYVFMVYSGESIARVFFITAIMFAGTSIYGYTTKKDLAGMGGLMIMGVWGLLIAMLVNLFLQSSMLQFVISGIGVIVYTGLVAWDTQNLKEMYRSTASPDGIGRMAVMGALSLYMNFIMLFQFLLQFIGDRR